MDSKKPEKLKPVAVKLQVKESRGVKTYFLTVPKEFINDVLKWEKGDIIIAEIIKHKGRNAIVYYKA